MLLMLKSQPKALSLVFFVEACERFSFYALQAILVLYFIKVLKFSDVEAYEHFGAFFAALYGLVAFGGFLGDKILGVKRTITMGLCFLILGYLSMALLPSRYIFFSLSLISVGGAVFKPNPPSLLSSCYADGGDNNISVGFTLYYMSINIGAIFARLIAPVVSMYYGYEAVSLLSASGIFLAIISYAHQYKILHKIGNAIDKKKLPLWQSFAVFFMLLALAISFGYVLDNIALARSILWIIIVAATLCYLYILAKQPYKVRLRMLLAFILILEAILFFTLYQQAPTSINLFAFYNIKADLGFFTIRPETLQILNPIWILILSPVMTKFYLKLDKANIHFSMPYKFAVGMLASGLGFLILYLPRFFHDELGMVSFYWLVLSYAFQCIAELLVSALGAAMIAELVPKSFVGFAMGMWFLTSSVAGFTGAAVAKLTALPHNLHSGLESLQIYTGAFAKIGSITVAIGILLLLLAPKFQKLMK
jgi:proton-dependent oligopeptide transporter, POT family